MGSIEDAQAVGTVRYCIPENDDGYEERSIFAFPPKKGMEDREVKLYDMRTDPDFVHGPDGVDVQGFTYVNHHSCLADGDRWLEQSNIEKYYISEVEELVCKTLGAKKAITNNIIFRRKPMKPFLNITDVAEKGGEVDAQLGALPRNKCIISGSDAASSLEPAPSVHTDYTRWGLRETIKYLRTDVVEAGKPALEAEQDDGSLAMDKGRYAAFSIWRPIKTVRRDPLVLCDARTFSDGDLASSRHRALSGVTENGEYICAAAMGLPPKDHDRHKFYWLPEQTQDEVLIIKHVDSGSDLDETVAKHCLHVGARLPGTENDPPRESLEARVFAFW